MPAHLPGIADDEAAPNANRKGRSITQRKENTNGLRQD